MNSHIEQQVMFQIPSQEAHLTDDMSPVDLGNSILSQVDSGVFVPAEDIESCREATGVTYLHGIAIKDEGTHDVSIVIKHPGSIRRAFTKFTSRQLKSMVSVTIE